MGKILSELDYANLTKGTEQLWIRLKQPYGIYSDVLGSEMWLPAGFECDGESVPIWLRGAVPPYGAAMFGAIPHDGLYTDEGYFNQNGVFTKVDRATADAVYHELLITAGIPKWRAWVRWRTLTVTGWRAWNQHRAEDKQKASLTNPAATL